MDQNTNQRFEIIKSKFEEIKNENKILIKDDIENIENKASNLDLILKEEISSDRKEREIQYKKYQDNTIEYLKSLAEMHYNFILENKEYLFLKNVIVGKLSYNRENVFVGLQVKEDFFTRYDSEKSTSKTSLFKDNDFEMFMMDIKELTRISHLLSFYEVHGLDDRSDIFASIVRKISTITTVWEYYDTKAKIFEDVAQNWLNGFHVYDNTELNEVEKIN